MICCNAMCYFVCNITIDACMSIWGKLWTVNDQLHPLILYLLLQIFPTSAKWPAKIAVKINYSSWFLLVLKRRRRRRERRYWVHNQFFRDVCSRVTTTWSSLHPLACITYNGHVWCWIELWSIQVAQQDMSHFVVHKLHNVLHRDVMLLILSQHIVN